MRQSLDNLPDYLTSAKYAWAFRLGLAVGVGLLVGLLSGLLHSVPVRADAGAQPVYQETDDYPPPDEFDPDLFPTDLFGYPEPGETQVPLPTFLQPDETESPEGTEPPDATDFPDASPQPTATIGPTLTSPPDVLATENAEMGDSQVTPPGSETPGPTLTPYITLTGTQTVLPSAVSPASQKGAGGLSINWGLFWIGFSIPVLVACGGVLYLLDRRPELFRRR